MQVVGTCICRVGVRTHRVMLAGGHGLNLMQCGHRIKNSWSRLLNVDSMHVKVT